MEPKQTSTFNLNPFQSEVFEAEGYRDVWLSAGEQAGKTSCAAFKARKEFDRWKAKEVSWVVGIPTYKIGSQSTRTYYKGLYPERLGHKYNGKDDMIQLADGRMVWFRSGTDVDSVIGIPNVVGGHLDEAGKCSKAFYEAIAGRSARLQGMTIGSTTPYGMTFEKREIVDRVMRAPDVEHWSNEHGECWKSRRESIVYVRFSILANPSYPKDEYERLKERLPRIKFMMRVEGKYAKPEGLVFQDMDQLNWVSPEVVDLRGAQYYGGVDWGFDHPFALSIRAITPERKLYGVSFFKKSGLSVTQQLDLIAAKTQIYGVKHWSCGHDRPEMIAELNKRQIPAFKYFEHAPEYREINTGNAKHAEILKTKQYRILNSVESKADLQDEYETYVWDKELDEEPSGKEKPKDVNNDLMSAERYCTVGTLHLMKERIEKIAVPLGYYQKRDLWKPTHARKSTDAY